MSIVEKLESAGYRIEISRMVQKTLDVSERKEIETIKKEAAEQRLSAEEIKFFMEEGRKKAHRHKLDW